MPEARTQIRLLIVDDHQVVRQGLRTFLELQPDMAVVGEAADGAEGVRLAQSLRPDIVLMDLVMPGMDGIEATRRIRAQAEGPQVIALTSFTEDDKVFPALEAGAASYLLKDVSPDALVDAIRAVMRGEARLHPDVQRKLMRQVARPKPPAGVPEVSELTARELEVLRCVARGMSNGEIARELVISEKTVKTHVSNLLGKLHLSDRTQLAVHALKTGLAGEGNPRVDAG